MNGALSTRPEFVLGTVQLGLRYGAANRTGLPSESEAISIVRRACASGVRVFDTARAYGDSEHRLGLALSGIDSVEVVTKLDPDLGPPEGSPELAKERARRSLEMSRRLLKRDLQTVLLHRAAHRAAFHGAVWDLLRTQRTHGHIGRLGVSVQSPAELIDCLQDPSVEHVQLPFNLLDYRWHEAGCLDALALRPDVRVHTRSAFLQGLLAAPEFARWPKTSNPDPARIKLALRESAAVFGFPSTKEYALSFVRAQVWIDGIVLGVENVDQLEANIQSFAAPLLHRSKLEAAIMSVRVDEALLDPSKW